MRASLLAKRIAELTLSKRAHDVVIMDLRGLTSIADFFVVCSADSEPQVRAIADAVEEGMDKKGSAPWHRESGSANWVLLDYVDVVLHVFHRNTRPFYNLEKLWGDAVFQNIVDKKPAAAKTPSRRTRPAPRPRSRRRIAS